MKNAIIASVIAKVKADMLSNNKGNFAIKNLSFREGSQQCKFGTLEAEWDFTDVSSKMEGGKFTFSGKGDFKIKLTGLCVTSVEHDGEFTIEELTANSLDDIKNMMVFLPFSAIGEAIDKIKGDHTSM